MTEIDGYTDLEVIGRGGFAVVYKAQQVSVGRQVAIKLLIDPSPDDDLIRRFERESKAVGALSWHPHIAAVVDAGATAAGQAYIVFELLSGGSLEDRISEAPMPWADAISSMIQVADAVEAAHRDDVLHRDIKPANILMDRLGVAKLGDFGIASMQDGTKTETGMLATTVAHAAPELFDGYPSSASTDVYALGSTLHNLVTGRPPYSPISGERIATTIAKIINQPPPRPDPAVVPDQVATVIAHALAKQPQFRPRSAAAFGQALQQVQRGLGIPVTAMPVSDAGPAPHLATPAPDPGMAQPQHQQGTPSGQYPVAPVAPMVQPQQGTPSGQYPVAPVAPMAQPQHGTPSGQHPVTRHVPFGATSDRLAQPAPKPYSRTIVALSIVALLLALGVGALALFQPGGTSEPIAVTAGGAQIASASAPSASAIVGFDPLLAFDTNTSTFWGIAPNPDTNRIAGTTLVIKFTEPQNITAVGIRSGDSASFARVSAVQWARTRDELTTSSGVTQTLPDEPGQTVANFETTTDELHLLIAGSHGDDSANAGVAEIIIQVAP